MKTLTAILLTTLMLSASFIQAKDLYQYLSPVPGSKMITVNHNIIIRSGGILNAKTVQSDLFNVHGSASGDHSFNMVIAADGKTIILSPLQSYAFSEEVTVSISNGMKTIEGAALGENSFSFQTHREYTSGEKENFKMAKSILLNEELKRWNIPLSDESETRDVEGMFEIIINTNPSPGHIFFDAFSGFGVPSIYTGYSVVTNNGDSLFNKETDFVDDFKLLRNGLFGVYNGTFGRYDVLDSNFNLINKIYPANGYGMDNHELQMTADGHAFIIAQEFQVIDMTVYDPSYYPYATVFGTVIQEFDENENLVFEWRAFDHVEITEALHENLSFGYIDYMHTNALEIDTDGNILASHRHLDQITKIDRNTGEFIWRLGGINNEFTFLNGSPTFSYQHDIRRINNGNITLFDNGNWNTSVYSSAREYKVDEENKTADLVWSYSHPANGGGYLYYFAMGSVQRLPNGNTFINWGWRGPVSNPSMSEVTPGGEIVWELKLTSSKNMVAYRGHKYEYDACARPTFKLMKTGNITSTSATLKWRPAWNAEKYKLQYSLQGSGIWKEKIVDGAKTSQNVNNLQPGSTYQWKLQTWCDEVGNVTSGYTDVRKFETAPYKPSAAETESIVTVYPNPATDYLMVSYSGTSFTELRLIDILSREVMSRLMYSNDENQMVKFSLKGIPAGNYFLELRGDQQSEVRQVIVE